MRNYNADPIEVVSEYSYENVRRFTFITTLGMRRLALAIAALAVLNVILLLVMRPEHIVLTDVMGLVAAAFMLPTALRSHAFSYRQADYEKQAQLYEGEHSTRLYAEELELISTNPAYDSSGRRLRYDALQKVLETGDAFYLFFNSRSAVFLEKSGIRNASVEELAVLLLAHVPEKKYNMQHPRNYGKRGEL